VRVLDEAGAWRYRSYQEVAELTRRSAGRLREAGVRAGDTVVVIRPASPEFIADFFGTLMLGATPVPVAPPSSFHDRSAYLSHLERIIRLTRPAAVVSTRDVRQAIAPTLGVPVLDEVSADACPVEEAVAPPTIGVIQFSSGSTSAPKGIRIPLTALQANVSAIYRWLCVTDADAYASWLPMHHDMGLIGQLMVSLERARDVWFMRPEDFIRSPLRWLECFGPGRATGSATPPFSLAYITRRVKPHQVEHLDLSGWRFLVVGAERIDADVLTAFRNLLEPCGLRSDVLVPAYGMAESTLAVAGAAWGEAIATVSVDSGSLVLGQPVQRLEEGRGTTLVGCGKPVDGMTVTVVDDNGAPVGPEVMGEIEVSGTSLSAGYLSEETGITGLGPSLRTGDAGFVMDGHLFVLGRLGDGVKHLGRWLLAEDVERFAWPDSPYPERTVALVGTLAGRQTAAILVENDLDSTAEKIGRAVGRSASHLRVLVISAPPHTILRTTSGKPRRSAMWRRLAQGDMTDLIVWDSDADEFVAPG
jgi:acyl-CoA synthetase (AMP-forming)/AMP-acid ligase II